MVFQNKPFRCIAIAVWLSYPQNKRRGNKLNYSEASAGECEGGETKCGRAAPKALGGPNGCGWSLDVTQSAASVL